MKKTLLLFVGLICSLSAAALTLPAVEGSANIKNADRFVTLEDGSVLGFYGYSSSATFTGAISTSTSISVPDSIKVGTKTIAVTQIGYTFADKLDMTQAESVTELFTPPTITNVYDLCDNIKDLHLKSPSVSLNYGDNPKYLTIWVPKDYLEDYRNTWPDYYFRAEGVATNVVNIALRTPGSLGNELVNAAEKWSDIDELVVSGSLNEEDQTHFAKLKYITKLDLSQTDITSIGNCQGLKFLNSVVLPAIVTTVRERAFRGCVRLQNINLPNVKILKGVAFASTDLERFDLSKVEEMEGGVFYGCESLKEVTLPQSMKNVPSQTFYYCSNLTKIELPETIKEIGSEAFSHTGLRELKLHEGLGIIRHEAFEYCKLQKIGIPSSIETIENSAFYGLDSLKQIDCFAVVPPENSGSLNTSARLNVPPTSVAAYRLHPEWAAFMNIGTLDMLVDDLTVRTDFDIYDKQGFGTNPNLNITGKGHLNINIAEAMAWGKYSQTVSFYERDRWNGNTYERYYPDCTTMLAGSPMTAQSVELSIQLNPRRWNFVSFPFDVKVSDIKMADGALWVVRKYSGKDRAELTGNTWQNMTENMTLRAGEGYIVHCSWMDESHSGLIDMTVTAVDNANKNNIFNHEDASVKLAEYNSEFAHNRSWNLVGNPYPCYYDIRSLKFSQPITVWNGSGYTALSPLDDQYILQPNGAFFVQKPADSQSIDFSKDGRTHSFEIIEESRAPQMTPASGRKVFNIVVRGNGYSDRARLVLNADAKADYEIERDASKFMSSNADVPQLYLQADGIDYAIMECPEKAEGYSLVFSAGAEGEYTISLDTAADGKLTLIDNETGEKTVLNEQDYTFVSAKGTTERRFSLIYGGDTTGIDAVEAVDSITDMPAYNTRGQRVAADAQGIVIVKGRKVLNK